MCTTLMCISVSITAAALLWTAPELLRIPRRIRNSEGSFTADYFSFGIIVYEVCYLTQPYGEQLTKLGAPSNAVSMSIHISLLYLRMQVYRCRSHAVAAQ